MECIICGKVPLNQDERDTFLITQDGHMCPECFGEDMIMYGLEIRLEEIKNIDE